MHTSAFKIDGETWTVHHHSDYSGDALVTLPRETSDVRGRSRVRTEFDHTVVSIPAELFVKMGRESMRDDIIALIEDME